MQWRDSTRRHFDHSPVPEEWLNYQSQGAPIPNPPAACANAGFNAYLTTAVPVVVGQTGQTSYCSEEDHSLRPYQRTSGFGSSLHRVS
jgi:hypothetical protein